MLEKIGISGTYKISINGKEIIILKNRIMNIVLDTFINAYNGITVDMDIRYLAFGNSNTAITDTQTQLGSEFFRTAISNQNKTNTGEMTSDFVILSTEAVAQIEEIGIFAGSTASSSANTGIMISRLLWSHNKLSSEEINIKRIDKIVRA